MIFCLSDIVNLSGLKANEEAVELVETELVGIQQVEKGLAGKL